MNNLIRNREYDEIEDQLNEMYDEFDEFLDQYYEENENEVLEDE